MKQRCSKADHQDTDHRRQDSCALTHRELQPKDFNHGWNGWARILEEQRRRRVKNTRAKDFSAENAKSVENVTRLRLRLRHRPRMALDETAVLQSRSPGHRSPPPGQLCAHA